jgi:pre-mRNA-processing factor SLU7
LSYCAGKAGIKATQASSARSLLAVAPSSTQEESREEGATRIEQNYSKKRVGEGDVRLDKDRLAQALSEEKKRKDRGEDDDRSGKRRKGVLEAGAHEVTEEELGKWLPYNRLHSMFTLLTEAFRMTRRMAEDPMANYVDEDL